MAQPFDPKRLALTGEAAPVAEHIRHTPNYPIAAISASVGGLLVYQADQQTLPSLTWFDRSGKRLSTLGDPHDFRVMHFSPDRKSVAVTILDGGDEKGDIWIFDVARGVRTRLTFTAAKDRAAIWSPNGKTLVYRSDKIGHFDLYRIAADGSGTEQLLYADDKDKTPQAWSPDGKFLLYIAAQDQQDIWALELITDKSAPGAPRPLSPFPFLRTKFAEHNAQFSPDPDSRWVSYQSNESGRTEIYIAPFPGPGGKRPVSQSGGALARWRGDGKEIFFVDPAGTLMAAEINVKGRDIEIGAPHPLFGPLVVGQGFSYDVSLDGQTFLAVVPPEQKEELDVLTVVHNWAAGLKK